MNNIVENWYKAKFSDSSMKKARLLKNLHNQWYQKDIFRPLQWYSTRYSRNYCWVPHRCVIFFFIVDKLYIEGWNNQKKYFLNVRKIFNRCTMNLNFQYLSEIELNCHSILTDILYIECMSVGIASYVIDYWLVTSELLYHNIFHTSNSNHWIAN